MKEHLQKHVYILLGFSCILLLLLIFTFLQLKQSNSKHENEIEGHLKEKALLEEELEQVHGRVATLESDLEYEQDKNTLFEEQIRDISGTVGRLDKLARTDEELLQKYSKVYFLNEHYTPEQLAILPEEYTYTTDKEFEIHEKVLPYLTRLMDEAQRDGVDLSVISSYRSYENQTDLKSHYTVVYGAGTANQFSADQGYSEHQLGTTVDFTTESINGSLEGFEETDGYTWLKENAHTFGFTLSYPEDNGYYIFEPWHWRYVGQDLATKLYKENLHFYDLTQREIDEYLVSIFD